METAAGQRRTPWGFWVGCVLAAVGGITPTLLAGSSGRLSGVIYPFWFAALAMAGCALFQHRGRFPATVLYLVASLAIVYGILGMFSLMLQLTVQTPCPAAPAQCPPGYARPLTSRENSGLDYATVLGMLAVGFGFVGMVANYRQHRARPAQAAPPVRRIAPAPAHQPEMPAAEPEAPATAEGAPE